MQTNEMYFKLTASSLGVLNVCSQGICCFLQKILEQHGLASVSCRSFYIPDDSGKGLLVLNKRDEKAEGIILESMHILGIKTAFIYAHDGEPDVNFVYNAGISMSSPWFWCYLTSIIALTLFIGLPGLFWVSFWGSAGWFSSRLIMSQRVSSWLSSWRSPVDKV